MKRYRVVLMHEGKREVHSFGRLSGVVDLLGMCAVAGCDLVEFSRHDGLSFSEADLRVFQDWMSDRRLSLSYDPRISVRVVVMVSVGTLEYFPKAR